MENKIAEIAKKNLSDIEGKKISRKEAITKTGYIVASAATMMLLLGTPKRAAASPAPPPANNPSPGNSGHRGPWK